MAPVGICESMQAGGTKVDGEVYKGMRWKRGSQWKGGRAAWEGKGAQVEEWREWMCCCLRAIVRLRKKKGKEEEGGR